MSPIRVLVVDDSLTVRMRLREAISEDPGFQVVGDAADGRHVLELCRALRPDVITLDMDLPGADGVEVTRQVMAERATPILVVSASANRGSTLNPFDALRAGAVDVFDKSRAGLDAGWSAELLARLRQVARIRVITRPWARPAARPPARARAQVDGPDRAARHLQPRDTSLVAIGASTGGPAAVARILSSLPRSFPVPIAVVLHVAPLFAGMLFTWLRDQSKLPVLVAEDGASVPAPGPGAAVFLAPPDRHLIVAGGRFRLTDAPEVHSCRPAVDVLFDSVAREHGPRAIGCLLTGMGRDGAAGLLAMRRAGARTIAEAEATCVVFGMPREAIERGAAELVMPGDEIAYTIQGLAGSSPARSSTT